MEQRLQEAMLIGMFLSKFDRSALEILGFNKWSEAFNVIGLSLNVNPLSVRNYRDEFDPFFPNKRKGWHNRLMLPTRIETYETYKNTDIDIFSNIIKRMLYTNPDIDLLNEKIEKQDSVDSTFAKRLITGQAAEQYFRDNYHSVDLFSKCSIEDTTKLGCGFDFKLNFGDTFYAVEVKGLSSKAGIISVTEKECRVANELKEKYFVFLVKNFIEQPTHCIYNNPFFNDELSFIKQEKMILQTTWSANV